MLLADPLSRVCAPTEGWFDSTLPAKLVALLAHMTLEVKNNEHIRICQILYLQYQYLIYFSSTTCMHLVYLYRYSTLGMDSQFISLHYDRLLLV